MKQNLCILHGQVFVMVSIFLQVIDTEVRSKGRIGSNPELHTVLSRAFRLSFYIDNDAGTFKYK